MGSRLSSLFPCFQPVNHTNRTAHQPDHNQQQPPDPIFASSEPLDETLGHSFCYVRSSNHFLSPTPSDRFVSPSHSLRFSPNRTGQEQRANQPETGFKAISGASVSANASTPRTVLHLDNIYDDATEPTFTGGYGVKSSIVNVSGFESTSSFCALPLQPVPRGRAYETSERAPFFLSGPLERGALSGPLDPSSASETSGGSVHFSAPLGGIYVKRKKKKGILGISGRRKVFYDKKRPWVVPVLNFVSRKYHHNNNNNDDVEEGGDDVAKNESENNNLQWALGKAGEDRVHVVVSEEHGWLFVGIYDGFNGPDAPEFLMGNLYRAIYNELHGLFWDVEEPDETIKKTDDNAQEIENKNEPSVLISENGSKDRERAKRLTFDSERTESRRRRLWEFLSEDNPEDGLDLSGSDRFAFSVDDAISVNKAGSAVSRGWLFLSKLKKELLTKHKENNQVRKSLFPWKFGLEEKEKVEVEVQKNRGEERIAKSGTKRKVGPVDHELVLRALSRALELTEVAYLDMTDKVLDTNPELALMGSCLLVVLMRDEDVYVMNVGDSRAIVAQYQPEAVESSMGIRGRGDIGSDMEGIVEESSVLVTMSEEGGKVAANEAPAQAMKLIAVQLSTDHSTSVEEEVIRIKNEHPDDSQCIVNDRLKGRLKVTRAFGAGFLKEPKLNAALLEMFRNEYIGAAPYLSCTPSLHHHRLCPRDQFLVLSSDGLYQYLTNQEVVSHVENFFEKFPDGDPAQHLIEELLFHAAKKVGMDLHELLDIPHGDRRKYHDDVTVMVISLEGRIWKSSGKYL